MDLRRAWEVTIIGLWIPRTVAAAYAAGMANEENLAELGESKC
jgi:hypothetical protein